jgi:CubicO group peptidase (beta-lactamase class C family)
MWASARDWARLGLLLINDGVWNGQRLLPEGWVDYVTTPTPGAEKGQYGAHFWLNAGDKNDPSNRRMPDVGTDVYMMNGYDGQRIYVVPSKNAVVVRMGKSKRGDFDFNAFLSGVIKEL